LRKRLLSILLGLALAIPAVPAMASSNASDATESQTAAPVVEPVGDQTFKGFLSAEPTTLDPAKASDNYAITVILAVYEPLVLIRSGADGKIEYEGGAAEKWDVSEDGKTYTFHLRDNKWSDGQPVKAEDYVYGIKRAIDPATGSPYAYLLEPIFNAKKATAKEVGMEEVGVKAIDDKTLEIKLENATPYFLGIMANSVSLAVRKDAVEKAGEKYGSEADTIITNGSHKVKEWVHNSMITLEKNDNYWNAAKVNFNPVTLQIITETNTAMSAMETGQIDSVTTNIGEWVDKFKSNANIEHRVIENPSTFFMTFNTKDKLFSNEKVRKAFSLAVNREELNEVIFYGNNIPASGWVPGNTFVGEKPYRENAENQLERLMGENPDPKALLSEGLTELGMDPNPEALSVTINLGGTDQWFKTYGEFLQQTIQENLGVTLTVNQMEWTVFSDKVQKGDYQIGYMAWGSELAEPFAMLALNTSAADSLGTGWSNAEYDKLVNEAGMEMDEAKRFDLYQQAETILMNESPIAPIVFSVSNTFTYKFVQGLDYNPFSNVGYRQGAINGR